MAAAVPPEAYIPAGSFVVPLDSIGLTEDEDKRVWSAAEAQCDWLLSQPVGGHPSEEADKYLPITMQRLILCLPAFSAVVRPFMHHWIRFSLSPKARSRPSQSPSPSPPSKKLGICRIYVLPEDEYRRSVPRSDPKLRRYLNILLNNLDYSREMWQGVYDETLPRTSVHAARVRTDSNRSGGETTMLVGDNDEGDDQVSLLQMFNTIPSPHPTPGLLRDESYQRVMDALAASKMRGLKSRLYSYQIRSASVMLQRELYPGRVVDPRLLHLTDQSAERRAWYYDDVNGEVLRAPRLYDGVSGGILAEEMGTGKTLICLALILATRAFPAEIPEVCRDTGIGTSSSGTLSSGAKHTRIRSLADMAATVMTHHSVPWKLYLEDTDANATEYSNCIAAIKRNPATYVLPRFKTAPREHARSQKRTIKQGVSVASGNRATEVVPPITISSCSLVLVPANLVRQWEQEIEKHTEGLRLIVVADKHQRVPSTAEILEADILLFSIPRFEKLEQDRVVTRSGHDFRSPLAAVHFKRVIVDEGHRLGNSKMGRKSNLLLVLDCLQVSARWIVTGTPSTGLFGVDSSSAESTPPPRKPAEDTSSFTSPATEALVESSLETLGSSSSLQERKDLERIGSMASLYLRVRPWANTVVEASGSDTPADWAVYVMQPNHSKRSSGRHDCLRATLDSLIIRHRKSEVGDHLPPVAEKVVLLEGSFQDKLCLNLFTMMIIFNAVQSQRTDQDYFFHPSQRSALLQLLSNIRQSTFYGAYFYSASEITKALETAENFLSDGKVPISADDERLLRDAIAFGRMAKQNKFKLLADRYHEVPIYVKDFPGGGECAAAWSIDQDGASADAATKTADSNDGSNKLTCTAAPMVRELQQFLRPCIDAPHSLRAMFSDGRFAQKGHETLHQQQQQQEEQSAAASRQKGAKPRPGPTLAGNTTLGLSGSDDSNVHATSPLKLKRRAGSLGIPTRDKLDAGADDADVTEVAAALARAQIVSTASAKLSYLIDAIVKHQADEQIIVFYDNENVAFYLAEHLEILQIRHMIYAKGITAERRAQYVETFNGTEDRDGKIDNGSNTRAAGRSSFRVLLMDMSQAAFGLDMRSASRVYFISPVLNPQVEAQAIGRVRRISQKRQVSVETLVLRDSLEEVIMDRRQTMTQAEHRKIKSILDDRPIYEWIVNAKIIPLPGGNGDKEEEHSGQMAPLKAPQFIFGRGFGRVEHPDEGLVAVVSRNRVGKEAKGMLGVGEVQSLTQLAVDGDDQAEDTDKGELGHGNDSDRDASLPPTKKRKTQPRAQVRFA